jgi:hypothetical protein
VDGKWAWKSWKHTIPALTGVKEENHTKVREDCRCPANTRTGNLANTSYPARYRVFVPFFDNKDFYKLKKLIICIAFTKNKNIKPASAHATHPQLLFPLPHGLFAARTPTKPLRTLSGKWTGRGDSIPWPHRSPNFILSVF